MEEGRSSFKMLTGKPRGNRPLGRPKRRWEDSIRMNFKKIANNPRNFVEWSQNGDYWRAFENAALNLRVSIIHGVRSVRLNCMTSAVLYYKLFLFYMKIRLNIFL